MKYPNEGKYFVDGDLLGVREGELDMNDPELLAIIEAMMFSGDVPLVQPEPMQLPAQRQQGLEMFGNSPPMAPSGMPRRTLK